MAPPKKTPQKKNTKAVKPAKGKATSTSPKLTLKQSLFVKEYLIDLNATQAAIRAGYSQKTAEVIGYENLNKPQIADAIQEAMDKRSEKIELSAEYVLTTIRNTVERCSQLQPVLDRKGMPVMVGTPLGDLSAAFTFDSSAVLKGCELLGKHLKLFTDKTEVEVSGGITINVVKFSDTK